MSYDFRQNTKGHKVTDKIARNLVDYEAGKTMISNCIRYNRNKRTTKQTELFLACNMKTFEQYHRTG